MVVDDVYQPTGAEGHDRGAAGVGLQAGVRQVVLPGGDHEHIGGGIEQPQADVVVEVAAVVHGKTEIGRIRGPALAEHHQFELFQRGAGRARLKAIKSFQQQIGTLARVAGAADGPEQHQGAIQRQTEQAAGLGLIAWRPHLEVDRIGDHRDRPAAHQGAAAGTVRQPGTGADNLHGPHPGPPLALPSVEIEIGAGFVARPVGGGVALGEPFIKSRRRSHIVLSTAEGPLIVKGPHHGLVDLADFFDGQGAAVKQVEVPIDY